MSGDLDVRGPGRPENLDVRGPGRPENLDVRDLDVRNLDVRNLDVRLSSPTILPDQFGQKEACPVFVNFFVWA